MPIPPPKPIMIEGADDLGSDKAYRKEKRAYVSRKRVVYPEYEKNGSYVLMRRRSSGYMVDCAVIAWGTLLTGERPCVDYVAAGLNERWRKSI